MFASEFTENGLEISVTPSLDLKANIIVPSWSLYHPLPSFRSSAFEVGSRMCHLMWKPCANSCLAEVMGRLLPAGLETTAVMNPWLLAHYGNPPQPTSILRGDKHLIWGSYDRFLTARRGRIPRYRWSWFRSMKSMKWLCLEIPWDRLVRALYMEKWNTPRVPKMGDTADGRRFVLVDLICWIS